MSGDAATLQSIQTYSVGSDIPAQQNGIVYANPNTIVSVSLSGVLNLFDPRESASSKWRTLHGPTRAITASALSDRTFYAGSFDGTMKSFLVGEDVGERQGTCAEVQGSGHSAKVIGVAADGKGKVWSAGWDNKVACIEGGNYA